MTCIKSTWLRKGVFFETPVSKKLPCGYAVTTYRANYLGHATRTYSGQALRAKYRGLGNPFGPLALTLIPAYYYYYWGNYIEAEPRCNPPLREPPGWYLRFSPVGRSYQPIRVRNVSHVHGSHVFDLAARTLINSGICNGNNTRMYFGVYCAPMGENTV